MPHAIFFSSFFRYMYPLRQEQRRQNRNGNLPSHGPNVLRLIFPMRTRKLVE